MKLVNKRKLFNANQRPTVYKYFFHSVLSQWRPSQTMLHHKFQGIANYAGLWVNRQQHTQLFTTSIGA